VRWTSAGIARIWSHVCRAPRRGRSYLAFERGERLAGSDSQRPDPHEVAEASQSLAHRHYSSAVDRRGSGKVISWRTSVAKRCRFVISSLAFCGKAPKPGGPLAGRSHPPQACSDSAPEIHLALLGGFELHRGGQHIELPGSSQRVLAFLALQTRPVTRMFVAGTLWCQTTDGSAQHCLRSTLWRLNRSCGDLSLAEATRTHLKLGSDVKVDMREQASLARRVLSRSADIDAIPQDALLEGELLPDWYDDWVLLERERLTQLRFHALEALGEMLMDSARARPIRSPGIVLGCWAVWAARA
jgi:hypothetical protein